MRREHYAFAGASHAARLQVNKQPDVPRSICAPGIGRGLTGMRRQLRLPGLAANLAFTLRQPTTATSPLGSTCDSALWFGADDGASSFSQLVQPGELLSTRPFYNVSQCRASSFGPTGSVVWLRLANVKAGFALSMSTCSGSQLVADTDLSIFAGPCDRLAQIACNGDSRRPAAQCQLGYSSISGLLPMP